MNDFSCDIYQATNFSKLIEVNLIHYVVCENCSVVRQYPYPSDIEIDNFYLNYKSYKSNDSIYLTENSSSLFISDKEMTLNDLGISIDFFKNKKLLDVGCATGNFLKMVEFYKLSYVKGIDISEECIKIAKSKNLNCENKKFLNEKDRYDIISMWHVIEHIRKPLEYIEHAYNLLNKDGILLIETPVVGKVSNSFGSSWRYYMPTEHINLFTFSSLVNISLNHGFKIKSFIRFGSGNDSDKISNSNKQAMDRIAKELGWGDTLAICLIK